MALGEDRTARWRERRNRLKRKKIMEQRVCAREKKGRKADAIGFTRPLTVLSVYFDRGVAPTTKIEAPRRWFTCYQLTVNVAARLEP